MVDNPNCPAIPATPAFPAYSQILGLGLTGAAWAQPAPKHDRNAKVYSGYNYDRDDANRGRGDRDEQNTWRNGSNARGSWNWGHSDMCRGKRDDR